MRTFVSKVLLAVVLVCYSQYAFAIPTSGPQTPAESKLGEICAANNVLQNHSSGSALSGLISDICDEQQSLASGYSCECRKSAVGGEVGVASAEKRCHSDSVKECAKNCSKNECKECCGTFTNEGNWAFVRCMDSCCGGMGKYDENYRCTN